MSDAEEHSYPGSEATVDQILSLAHAYRSAALLLFETSGAEAPLSRAPARLCAMHAIELYLNAYLRHRGVPAAKVRGRMHRLADPVALQPLNLRKRTVRHLETITSRREYLIARYAPDQLRAHSELNRLNATLVEVMTKVGTCLTREPARGA